MMNRKRENEGGKEKKEKKTEERERVERFLSRIVQELRNNREVKTERESLKCGK